MHQLQDAAHNDNRDTGDQPDGSAKQDKCDFLDAKNTTHPRQPPVDGVAEGTRQLQPREPRPWS